MSLQAEPCWHVYLVECADSTYYCGVTNNIGRRLKQHNGQLAGGAKYTRARRPVRLLVAVACPDKSTACSLEYAIKAVPREQKTSMLAACQAQFLAGFSRSPEKCP